MVVMARVLASWWLRTAWVLGAAALLQSQAGAQETLVDGFGSAASNETAAVAASLCDSECFFYPPRCPIYFRADGVMLRRDVHNATDIATLNDTDTLVLSTRDLDMPFKAGPRFLVGHTFGDSPYQVEYSYFWLDNLDVSAAVRDNTANSGGGVGNLFSPFSGFGLTPVTGLDYNNLASIREFSTFQNMELNLRRQLPMPEGRLTTSFLIGARGVGVREQFDYFTRSDLPSVPTTNSVRVRTRNELYGVQIGQLFEFNVDQLWWINTELKGAICNNSAGQNSVYTQSIGGVATTYDGAKSTNGTSFIGDIAVTLVCRPTDHVTARLGYQAIWFTGMAIAAKNLGNEIDILTTGPAQINNRGTVVYHGPHAGLEIAW